MRIHLTIEPIAASRPRFSKYGPSYYAEPYNSFKKDLKDLLKEYAGDTKPTENIPCMVYVEFCLKRPGNPAYEWPTRGDGDNFEKALYDAMNEVIIDDDRHLISGEWFKSWQEKGKEGCIDIYLIEVDPSQLKEEWTEFWKEHDLE